MSMTWSVHLIEAGSCGISIIIFIVHAGESFNTLEFPSSKPLSINLVFTTFSILFFSAVIHPHNIACWPTYCIRSRTLSFHILISQFFAARIYSPSSFAVRKIYLAQRNIFILLLFSILFLLQSYLTNIVYYFVFPDEEKILTLIFIFTLLCGASKGFRKVYSTFWNAWDRNG